MLNSNSIIFKTKCEDCTHVQMCKYASEFKDTYESNNVKTIESEIKDTPFQVNIECKLFRKNTGTVRTCVGTGNSMSLLFDNTGGMNSDIEF